MGSFGERVKSLREGLGLTQLDFGNMVGLSSGAMSNVESGKRTPTFDSLISICEVASQNGIDVAWLLTGKDGKLSSRENTLLSLFRALPEEQQNFYISALQGAVDALPRDVPVKKERKETRAL